MNEITSRMRGRLCTIWLPMATVFILLAWAGWALLSRPVVGVADILDFWRVMRPAGIEHNTPLEYPGYFVRADFVTGDADLLSAPSSSAAMAWAARSCRWAFGTEPGNLDLRQMGLVWWLLLVFTVWLSGAFRAPWWLLAAITFIAVDPGYLLFFNSFYADAAMITGLVAATLWFEVRSRANTHSPLTLLPAGAVLWLMALTAGASKMQYVLFAWITICAVAASGVGRRSARRSMLVIMVGLLVLGAGSVWLFFDGPGPRFLAFNNYHAVFGGLLKATSDDQHAFQTLRISEPHRDLARTDAWSAGVGPKHPVHDELKDLSRLTLLRLYLTDPGALIRTTQEITGILARIESHPRGTMERRETDHGPHKRVFTVWWQHSRTFRRTYTAWPGFWLILTGAAAWILRDLIRTRRASGSMVLLWVWTTSQFGVAVLGEGFVNLHQHLVGARLGLDLLVVVMMAEYLRRRTS